MADRTLPYSAFNFAVDLGGEVTAGFSDVSGLSTDVTVAEYRAGNDKARYTHKLPGLHKTSDVTLKRGVINSKDLQAWMQQVRDEGPVAKRDVVITMFDETGTPVQSWKLHNAMPLKYTGPTLAGKGGGDVAMEELVLSVEELQFP